MSPLYLLGVVAAGVAYLIGRGVARTTGQSSAARSAGLAPVRDLSHLPETLQKTALWNLADGGFERRVLHGVLPRGATDVDITAFDMETLRDRRGEWAWLPVEPPFRIAGVVSVVVCELDRVLPHVLLKRAGRGDDMIDDNILDRAENIAKLARDGLGMPRSYAAEMPGLPTAPLDVALPEEWRAYGRARDELAALLAGGLSAALATGGRRDLVVELIGTLVVVYPAAREVAGADAFADLTSTALRIADGVLAATPALTPRGVADAKV